MLTEPVSAAGNPYVTVRAFTKVYGRGTTIKTACNGIDFSAQAGSVTGILGLNGAGKSTLLKAICGAHYPTAGSVTVCGTSSIFEIRRLTAFVPEIPVLDGHMTVRESLFYASFLRGKSKKEAAVSADHAAELCGLTQVLAKKTAALSKGYMQRTSLAQALAMDTPVLVLDEFSAGLDPAQTVQMRSLLSELALQKCIILSTHHIEEAQSLCKHIYILANGKVAASGAPQEIIMSSGSRTLEEAFLSVTGTGDAEGGLR